MAGLLRRVQIETPEQIRFDLKVPMPPEGGEVIKRLAHGHPGIKRHRIGHVGKTRLHGHFMVSRVQAKHADAARSGPQQIEQTFDGGRFPGAIASEKAETSAGPHVQAESVDRVEFAEAACEIFDFDDCRRGIHEDRSSWLLACSLAASRSKNASLSRANSRK